jgi:hypothetical protein
MSLLDDLGDMTIHMNKLQDAYEEALATDNAESIKGISMELAEYQILLDKLEADIDLLVAQ